MNQESSKPGRSRIWRWRNLLFLLIVLATTLYFVRPYFWTQVSPYQPARPADPAVPPMSMLDYMEVVADHPRPYVLKYSSQQNELLLFGISHHTNDPQDADILQIENQLKAVKPDLCLIEGRMGTWIAGHDGVVKKFGESGLVNWYARQNGVSIYTLELPLEEEVQQVVKSHSPEHVALFYVLRPYFGARRAGPIENPEAFIAESLRKRTSVAGIDNTFKTIDELDELWKKDFSELPDWRDCDDRNGWPGRLANVGATANAVRNQHWLSVFNDLLNGQADSNDSPQKIFAVVGCSHVVRLQPALDSMFQAAESNPALTDWKKAEPNSGPVETE